MKARMFFPLIESVLASTETYEEGKNSADSSQQRDLVLDSSNG